MSNYVKITLHHTYVRYRHNANANVLVTLPAVEGSEFLLSNNYIITGMTLTSMLVILQLTGTASKGGQRENK